MLALADVAVTVKDAKASAAWWKEKLGFESFTIGPPNGHALMIAPPGERFVLHLCEGFADVEPGNTGIAFVTDALEERVQKMVDRGVEFPEPYTPTDWGGSAKFADPDGNVFWMLGAPTRFIQTELKRRAPDRTARPASRPVRRRRAPARRPRRPRSR